MNKAHTKKVIQTVFNDYGYINCHYIQGRVQRYTPGISSMCAFALLGWSLRSFVFSQEKVFEDDEFGCFLVGLGAAASCPRPASISARVRCFHICLTGMYPSTKDSRTAIKNSFLLRIFWRLSRSACL